MPYPGGYTYLEEHASNTRSIQSDPFTQDGTDQSPFYAQVWDIVRIKKDN
jgi:hypothetical protein